MVKEKTVFPVLLTFDLDGEFAFEEIHPRIPYWTTQGEYGPRVGVYRILDLLHRENIKATFCVVGKTAEKYPEAVEAIVEKGHEIAVHGYTHRGYNALEPEQESGSKRQGTYSQVSQVNRHWGIERHAGDRQGTLTGS